MLSVEIAYANCSSETEDPSCLVEGFIGSAGSDATGAVMTTCRLLALLVLMAPNCLTEVEPRVDEGICKDGR